MINLRDNKPLVVLDELGKHLNLEKLTDESIRNLFLLANIVHVRANKERLFNDFDLKKYAYNYQFTLAHLRNVYARQELVIETEYDPLTEDEEISVRTACLLSKYNILDINKGFKDSSLPWNRGEDITFELIRDYFADVNNYLKLFAGKNPQLPEIKKVEVKVESEIERNIKDAIDYAQQARDKLLEKLKNDNGMEK